MKGLKALGTVLVNPYTNFNLKPKHLFGNLKGSLIKLYKQNVSILFNQTCLNERLLPNSTHTHTHIYIYIYVPVYVRVCVCVCVCYNLPNLIAKIYDIFSCVKEIFWIKNQNNSFSKNYQLKHVLFFLFTKCKIQYYIFFFFLSEFPECPCSIYQN